MQILQSLLLNKTVFLPLQTALSLTHTHTHETYRHTHKHTETWFNIGIAILLASKKSVWRATFSIYYPIEEQVKKLIVTPACLCCIRRLKYFRNFYTVFHWNNQNSYISNSKLRCLPVQKKEKKEKRGEKEKKEKKREKT